MASIKFDFTSDNKNLLNSAKQAQTGVTNAMSAIERSGRGIESVFHRIQAAMSAGLMGFSAVGLGKQIMAIRGEFQQLEVAFTTMLGSEKKANALMEQLVNTAAKTPFDLKSVAAGAKSLMAYGTAAEDVNEMLTRLGDIAAGMSIPLNDLVYLYGTTMTQGRMFTQDLRQFQGRGIPIADEIAKIMGVTKQAVGDLVTAGKVTSDVFHQAILNMTNEGSKFGGLMDAQSKTITGQISNIEDAIDMMFNDIGKQSEGIINEGLGAVSYLIDHYKEIGEAVLIAATAFGAYKAALMVTVAATNSYQKLNFGKQMEALNAEIEALIPAQQASANADLEQAVAKGELTAAQAEEIANRRELLAQMQQGTTASGMTDDLDAQISQARELLGIKEESKNADLDAMVAKGQINEAQAKEIADKRSLLETLSEEVEKRREAAQEALDAAFDEKEAAQQNFEMMSDYADAAEEAYANALDMGDAEEIEAAREKMLTAVEAQNTAEKRLNAATTQVQAAQKEVNSLATTANTTATTANTAAETTNTAATNTNTLSQKMHAISAKAGALAQSILTFAINGTTAALNMMKTAIMTNPIGVLIGAVTIAWPLISKLTSKTDDATAAQKRYNDSTAEATANVKALYATLGTANKTSKVAADTAKELKQVADEYGVKLSEEATKIGNETKLVEELTAKREELIDAIRREAIERERANQQKQIEDEYAAKIQEAREEFLDSLSDDFSSQAKGIMSQLITDEDLERIGRAEAKVRQLREVHGEYSVAVADAERERASMTDELVKKLWDYSAQLGKTEGDETKYADAASNMKDAVIGLLRATNDSTVAQQNAKQALAEAILAQTEQIKVQDAAKVSADALNSRTQALIELWNSAHPEMTFTIHFDDSEIPQWMKGMTDDVLASSIAARQQLVDQARKSGAQKVRYGGREMTVQEAGNELSMMQQIRNGRTKKPTITPKASPTTTTKPKKTPKKTGKTSSWNQAHADADAKEMLEDWKEEMKDLMADVQQDITDASIEILDESTEKTLQKLQEDENKEVEAILKQRRDLIEKRKELDKKLWEKSAEKHDKYDYKEKTDAEYAAMIEAEAPGLLGALGKRTKQITDSYKKQREELTKELAKQEREAMLSYLKEYGDMEQQRLAITQEYDAKIAEARKKSASDYEIASLAMERDKQLRELDTKAIEQKIDWTGVFSSLEGHTKDYLEGLRNQLQSILNAGNLPVDQMAVIQDKLREINAAISEQGTMFDYIGERARENARLQQEASDAKKELATARKEQETAEANLEIARRTGSKSDIITAESKLADARKKTAAATAKAKAAEDAAARTSAQKIADTFADAAEWVNKYLGDLPDLLGKLGLGGAGEKAQMGIDAVNNAAGAAADYASGNYVGAALKAFNALDNIGNIVGAGGLSDKTLEAGIERLTQSNENLQKAIDALADELSDASVLDIKDIYIQQQKMLEQTEKNYREMMSRSGAAYDSGFWGTGIGGSHSSNKNINDALSASDWAAVSKAAGTSVRSAADFWNLSSKQMYQVMRDANAQWTEIMDKANDGTADAAKFMNEYIELWKKQEEIEDQYKERWTSVSFDTVKSSFLSALSDMDKSASDFSQDFTKYLFDAVMNAQVGELLEKELKGWYADFANYMESGAGELTDAEIQSLRDKWDSIVQQGVSMRDAISAATGYTGSSSEGSATYNAAKSFTQEQGDILNGRLTAIQIHTAEGNAIGRQIAASLQSMAAVAGSTAEANTAVLEIRNMMIYTNSHLEDLVRYAKATYNDFGIKLDNVINNLNTKL